MIKYKKTVNHIGWILGVLTSILYVSCAEPTLSFWDSGEYILTSSKLQVGHPPGAPFYQLLGAFFSIFSFGNPKLIPILVNSLSAIASGATVCFLFWIIVRLMYRNSDKFISNIITGVIGALVFAFSDTFWNSAIEAEVYSVSILFTAITFWSILKWDEKPHPRWVFFICLMVGISINIHLLSLLVLPAVFLIVYFHYKKGNLPGIISTIIVACGVLFLLLWFIIPGIIRLISINPKWTIISILFLIVLLTGLSLWKKLPLLNTISLSVFFFLIGFSTFLIIVIRADADTPINEYNPSNSKNIVSYINRDAYGETPLIYGPSYTALPPKDFKMTEQGIKPIFERELMMFFPRMWNYNNPNFEQGYTDWVGMPQDTVLIDGELRAKPSWIQNLQYFANYQIGYMYGRYLLWNFVGKTNDLQGYGDNHKGEWFSGIFVVDEFLNKGTNLSPEDKKNKANNIYFGIPFLLAIIGMFYQIGKDIKGWFVLSTLFVFTGVAISIYLNDYAYQPRERDYVYVGSFMVFSIWIAMGAFALSKWLLGIVRIKKPKYVLPSFLLVPALLFSQNFNDHNRSYRYTANNFAYSILNSCEENAILFVSGDNDTYPLWYLQEVEGIRQDVRVINLQFLNNADYISKLKQKIHTSLPLNFIAKETVYSSPNRELSFINPSNNKMEMNAALRELYNNNNAININNIKFYALPTNKLYINADSTNRIDFSIEGSDITKSTMMLYDIIANNFAQRPIYFSSYSFEETFGLEEYLSNEGFVYRLKKKKQTPNNANAESKVTSVSSKRMYENLMHNYQWKNFDKKGIYYDELHRSIIELYAWQASLLAHTFIAEGEAEKSLATLNLCLEKLPTKIHSYPYIIAELSIAYGQLEEEEKSVNLMSGVVENFSKNMDYFLSLSPKEQSQRRLDAQRIMFTWINLCEVSEQMQLESLRVLLANRLFNYLSPYYLTVLDQMENLNKDPQYYSEEIDKAKELIETIKTFANKYEEPLPEKPQPVNS